MNNASVQADLETFSSCSSPDEERLLSLYRASPWEDKTQFLYKITRLRFSPYFAEVFNKQADARDPTYLHEELEQALREICPREALWEIGVEDFYIPSIFISAWGGIAPVILGATEKDGQRADELYRAILGHCDEVQRNRLSKNAVAFKRQDALKLIEDWREAALKLVFLYKP
jgi:peptide subunit release factor RF-3